MGNTAPSPAIAPLPRSAEEILQRLTEKERELGGNLDRIRQLETNIETSNKMAGSATELIEALRREILEKNTQFVVISEQIKKLREVSAGLVLSEDEEEVRNQFLKLKRAIQAHQTQNAFLAQELQRQQDDQTAEITAIKANLAKANSELVSLRQHYQELRKRLLLGDGKLSEEFLADVEKLKKDYFYSLAVSAKLTRAMQGKPTNIRVDILFEKAKSMKHSQWNDWLARTLDSSDGSPSEKY